MRGKLCQDDAENYERGPDIAVETEAFVQQNGRHQAAKRRNHRKQNAGLVCGHVSLRDGLQQKRRSSGENADEHDDENLDTCGIRYGDRSGEASRKQAPHAGEKQIESGQERRIHGRTLCGTFESYYGKRAGCRGYDADEIAKSKAEGGALLCVAYEKYADKADRDAPNYICADFRSVQREIYKRHKEKTERGKESRL